MNKPMALFLALAFAAGTAGLASAQSASSGEKKMTSPATKRAGPKKAAAKSASGTVKSLSSDSVVVAGKVKGKEAEWTFAVDEKTKIKKGGKSIAAGDLKAGDSVSVRYMEREGKTIAHVITVRVAPVPKKAGTNPAAKK